MTEEEQKGQEEEQVVESTKTEEPKSELNIQDLLKEIQEEDKKKQDELNKVKVEEKEKYKTVLKDLLRQQKQDNEKVSSESMSEIDALKKQIETLTQKMEDTTKGSKIPQTEKEDSQSKMELSPMQKAIAYHTDLVRKMAMNR